MTDDITEKGKRGKKSPKLRIHYHTPCPTGAHAAAEGAVEQAKKDKGIPGNPVGNVHSAGSNYAADRVSEPLADGHAAYSTGDHGVGQGRNNALAAGHQDLRQSNTSFDNVIATLRTERGDRTAAENGLGGFAYAGEVALRAFAARDQAGTYAGMNPVSTDPSRQAAHQSRGSGTPANPVNPSGQYASQSRPRPSMKNSDALDIIKNAMRANGQ
jgi:hypothetical protein